MKRFTVLLLILTLALPGLAWAEETPAWAEDGVLRILGVGNSYTEDTFWELYDVGQALGVGEMELATLVIGGTHLNRHYAMLQRESSRYILHRNTDGRWITKQDGALSEIRDVAWDFVIIQEHSLMASRPDAISNVGRLADALQEMFPDAVMVWNMTWSYPPENTETEFITVFESDGAAMYQGIVETVKEKILPLEQIDLIIPNGTAIQNARETYLGDATNLLFRDSLHLADGSGRTIAAMNTLATLIGVDVSPMLETLSNKTFAACAVEAVQHARENPWEVTPSQYASQTE